MRRSLFASEAERSKFLNHLVTGTRDILRVHRGLDEHANYHEFCRLLGRLKTNYQLSELVSKNSENEPNSPMGLGVGLALLVGLVIATVRVHDCMMVA